MASQAIWIGIVVGVFFVGLVIGYAALQSTVPSTPIMMTPQQMQQMMNNPQAMNQWMNTMMDNPQSMQYVMGPMMNDPQLSQQMYDTMLQHNQFMQGMMNYPNFQNQWMGQMNQGMMGSGMMGGMMMEPGMMMGTPITKQSDVITTINNIENILNQVSSSYRSGDKNTAFSLATNAYLENYEYIEGAIAQKDRTQMEKIETMMRIDLRSMINNGDTADNVDAKINSIKTELRKVKSLFQ